MPYKQDLRYQQVPQPILVTKPACHYKAGEWQWYIHVVDRHIAAHASLFLIIASDTEVGCKSENLTTEEAVIQKEAKNYDKQQQSNDDIPWWQDDVGSHSRFRLNFTFCPCTMKCTMKCTTKCTMKCTMKCGEAILKVCIRCSGLKSTSSSRQTHNVSHSDSSFLPHILLYDGKPGVCRHSSKP